MNNELLAVERIYETKVFSDLTVMHLHHHHLFDVQISLQKLEICFVSSFRVATLWQVLRGNLRYKYLILHRLYSSN